MKKDIYIIKNKNNNKVYIGQTVNPKQRWAQYKSAVKKMPNEQLITKAMKKYGIETFWMEILESDRIDYDEREKYWIQYYNSVEPFGYNLAPGGKGTGNEVLAPGAAIKNEEELLEIIEEIIVSEKSLKEIAEKYKLSYQIINEINQGHTYFNPDLNYPLRESKRYSEDKLKQITYSLKYELDKSMADIAKEFGCDRSYINDINQGHSQFREYLTYPLRTGKMKYREQYLPLLIEDLKNTNVPQKELAKKYQISQMSVSKVNTGEAGRQPDLVYPIRGPEKRGRSCFTPNELRLIYKDLREDKLSMREIGDKYGVNKSIICNINSGKTKKYHDNNIKYPIREK